MQTPWTVVLLCTSPRGNSLSMAIAKQLNRHWRNIAACLICRGVNVLSRFLGFAFNAEQAISSFRCYVFVRRYEIKYDKDDYVLRVKKASVNDEGTFTCVTENRVGKLEASATLTVRGTKHLPSLLFHINWYKTTLREVTDHWACCTCTSVWGLDWQFPPQGPIYANRNPDCWLRQPGGM